MHPFTVVSKSFCTSVQWACANKPRQTLNSMSTHSFTVTAVCWQTKTDDRKPTFLSHLPRSYVVLSDPRSWISRESVFKQLPLKGRIINLAMQHPSLQVCTVVDLCSLVYYVPSHEIDTESCIIFLSFFFLCRVVQDWVQVLIWFRCLRSVAMWSWSMSQAPSSSSVHSMRPSQPSVMSL